MKRDSQSPETHAGALEPRAEKINLFCGRIPGGGQSHVFGFRTNDVVRLLWDFRGAPVALYLVKFMVERQGGPDLML